MNTISRCVLSIALVVGSPIAIAGQAVAFHESHPLAGGIVIPRNVAVSNEAQADSAFRVARRALDEQDFSRAARLFAQVAERYPKTTQAPEALYWRAYALFRSGGSSNLSAALASLSQLGRVYPASAAYRGDAGSLRIRICGEMARRGDEDCAREVVASASSSSSASSSAGAQGQARSCPAEDDDNDERIMALNALLNMNSDAAVPILERTLARRDDCSRGLRRKAVFLLAQKRADGVVDILLKVAREDPAADVREQAVFWLSNVRDPRVVDVLAEMATNASDPVMQEKAIFALSNTRGDRASQVLRDIAQRDGTAKGAREQAIFWLGNRRDSSSVAFLRTLYAGLTDADLKDKVLFAVSNQRGTDNGKWLIDIATNAREPMQVRKQALFYAGSQRAASPADFASLYDRLTDREMKEQVIFVLSQNRADAAVDKLMDIARRDTDREMRSKAIFWLGQSRDPRVLKFLEEVINR